MRKLLTLLCVAASTGALHAQTALPYYTGFDNAAEQAGWTNFHKGNTGSTYTWSMGPGTGAPSSPNILASPNAEFSNTGDTLTEWFVSPPFSLHAGGHLDSMAIHVLAAGGYNPHDSIVIYLLKGSNNPSLATSITRIADLTHMSCMLGGCSYRDTGNFVLPPTAGTSYLAFKYYALQDWFVVEIDNLHISSNPTTAIGEITATGNINVYPNPASNTVDVDLQGLAGEVTLSLADVTGRQVSVKTTDASTGHATIDLSRFNTGTYLLTVHTQGGGRRTQPITVLK